MGDDVFSSLASANASSRTKVPTRSMDAVLTPLQEQVCLCVLQSGMRPLHVLYGRV